MSTTVASWVPGWFVWGVRVEIGQATNDLELLLMTYNYN